MEGPDQRLCFGFPFCFYKAINTVKHHWTSGLLPTMASIWLGEEEITSMCTDFFQNNAKQPILLTLGTIQKQSNKSSPQSLFNLPSSAQVSAKKRVVGSCA